RLLERPDTWTSHGPALSAPRRRRSTPHSSNLRPRRPVRQRSSTPQGVRAPPPTLRKRPSDELHPHEHEPPYEHEPRSGSPLVHSSDRRFFQRQRAAAGLNKNEILLERFVASFNAGSDVSQVCALTIRRGTPTKLAVENQRATGLTQLRPSSIGGLV